MSLMEPPLEGEVVCGATLASCRCTLAPHKQGPDSPHTCTAPTVLASDCNGKWYIDEDGQAVPVELPAAGSPFFDDPFNFLFGL